MGPRSFILPLTPHRCRRRCSSVHILLSTLKGCRGKWLSIRVKHVAVIVVAKQQHSHSTEFSVTLVKRLKLVEFRGKTLKSYFYEDKKVTSHRFFSTWHSSLFGRLHENICYITYDIFMYTGAQSIIRPLKSRIACKKLVEFQSFIWGHTSTAEAELPYCYIVCDQAISGEAFYGPACLKFLVTALISISLEP